MNVDFEHLVPGPTEQQVADKLMFLQDWLADAVPGLDVQDPVLNSVVLVPWINRLIAEENRITVLEQFGRLSYRQLESLSDQDAQTVRSLMVQLLGLSVQDASRSIGTIRLVVNSTDTLIVPIGTVFRYGDVKFQNPEPLIARLAGSSQDNSKSFSTLGSGYWYVDLSVLAQEPGQLGNLAAGTKMLTDLVAPSLVDQFAATSFVGGSDPNSLDDMIRQVYDDTFAQTVGTRDQLVALIGSGRLLGGIRQIGVVGIGDVEHRRGQHPFLPVQRAGLVDIYLAATYYPVSYTFELDGTVLLHGPDGNKQNLVMLDVQSELAPGFLRVTELRDSQTGQLYDLVDETRSYQQTPKPDIQLPTGMTDLLAGFSAFQTARLYGKPQDGNLVVGEQKRLRVTVQRLAGLDILQDRLQSRQVRSLAGDLLVKAACPIFLSVTLQLQSQYSTQVPDVDKIKQAVVDLVSRRPMRAEIRVSDLASAISRYLPEDVSIREAYLEGDLILPTGKLERLYGVDVIQCPDRPFELVTARTSAFYCSIDNVTITFNKLIASGTP
jgi:hypothetical protein